MPRPKLTPDQQIRKLRSQIGTLSNKLDKETRLAADAQHRAYLLDQQVEDLKALEALTPDDRRDRGNLSDLIGVELTLLYDLLKLLEEATPAQRYRVLSLADAYFYDPPSKAAK